MVWIDFRKAYNMVPHSWMIKPLEMAQAAKNIVNLLKETMKNWKKKLNLWQYRPRSSENKLWNLPKWLIVTITVFRIPPALTPVLRKMKHRYSFSKGKSKLNHLLFIDDLKLYGGSQPDIDSLIQTVYTATHGTAWDSGLVSVGFWQCVKVKSLNVKE